MFHPELRLLRSFAAIAAEGSLTRAAERLNLTQPTVSGQLKELEQAIGHPLFHRTTRSVALSVHGARLLPLVDDLLVRAERLRQEVEAMQSADRTRFRLGAAMYTMDLPERVALLDAFAAEHPEIGYSIDNRLQSAQIPDLVGDRLDVSVLLGISAPCVEPGMDATTIYNETQYPDTLDRVVLRRQAMNLLVPRGSPLEACRVIPRSALRGVRVAMINHEHGSALTDPIEAFFADCGAELVIPAEGNALAVERYAERHGICALGIGWFPVPPGLAPRAVEGLHFWLDFAVVLGRDANRAARQFFAFARRWQAAREATETGPVA
ncbi:MAG: LysR family transcriptional regulator [Sphingomonas adhaesiva]|uniref:LysR family transcriptional regulator n=1 Tax=Sphingomonas adhaesiva TaxID=28212 RepID=UPI002FF4D167